MYALNMNTKEILQDKKVQEWEVSKRQIQYYIKNAKRKFEDNELKNINQFRELKRKQLDILFEDAYLTRDITECRRIIETQNKILGYDKITVDVNDSSHVIEMINKFNKIFNDEYTL